MMQKQKWIFIASMAAAVAACGGNGQPVNTSLYSVNQPVVSRTHYVMDVNTDSSGISSSENTRLIQWMSALDVRYGDRISMDYGNGYSNPAATQDLNKLAASRGLLVSRDVPVTEGEVTPGTVRVIVTRSTASVPNCPNWSKTDTSNYRSSNSPGYGCSVNGNMAAMVADPEDLIRGKDRDLNKGNDTSAIDAYNSRTTGGN